MSPSIPRSSSTSGLPGRGLDPVQREDGPVQFEFDRKRPVVAILGTDLYIIAIDNTRTNSSYWDQAAGHTAGAQPPMGEP